MKEMKKRLELDRFHSVCSGWFLLMLVRHEFYLDFFEKFDESSDLKNYAGLYMKRANDLPKVCGTKVKLFNTYFIETK